jgi:uncharacterized protein (TIGR01777 family)
MRWLITGGTGMIGRVLTAKLQDDGHEVTVLSRNPQAHEDNAHNIQFVKWDGVSTEGWGHIIERTDVVVNMAGERIAGPNPIRMRWTPARKERLCSSRANAGKALVQAIEKTAHKPDVLVQFSGVDYYPPSSQTATETTPPGDDFLARICSQCWEPSTQPVEKMGIRRVILRLGPVLHPKEGALPPMILQTRLFLGGPLGSGRQYFSWVHIDDVIAAIRFIVDNPEAAGIYNLTAPNPVTNTKFMRTIAHVIRRPSFLRVPGLALKILFGEMSRTLLQGPKVYPERLMADGYTFHFPEVEGAIGNLIAQTRKD